MKLQRSLLWRTRPSRSRAGFGLLETLLGLTVIMVGLTAMTSTSVTVRILDRNDSEVRRAARSIAGRIDEIRAEALAARGAPAGWARTLIDAYSEGGAIGPTFDVAQLDAQEDEPRVGRVTFVTDERAQDASLGVQLGLPRDLDNDGFTATEDVTDTANLLPVLITVRWSGNTGDREITQGIYVMRW
jgi:hypothetical protein